MSVRVVVPKITSGFKIYHLEDLLIDVEDIIKRLQILGNLPGSSLKGTKELRSFLMDFKEQLINKLPTERFIEEYKDEINRISNKRV